MSRPTDRKPGPGDIQECPARKSSVEAQFRRIELKAVVVGGDAASTNRLISGVIQVESIIAVDVATQLSRFEKIENRCAFRVLFLERFNFLLDPYLFAARGAPAAGGDRTPA